MSELDTIYLAIGVGGLLLIAVLAGFALMWQRQKHLHFALQEAWGTHTTGLPTDLPSTSQTTVAETRDRKILAGQASGAKVGAQKVEAMPIPKSNPSAGVIAPLGSPRNVQRKGSEEDHLRALLAGRGAVRPDVASPQQRPWSPSP